MGGAGTVPRAEVGRQTVGASKSWGLQIQDLTQAFPSLACLKTQLVGIRNKVDTAEKQRATCEGLLKAPAKKI